jgi:hypothetical protein
MQGDQHEHVIVDFMTAKYIISLLANSANSVTGIILKPPQHEHVIVDFMYCKIQ